MQSTKIYLVLLALFVAMARAAEEEKEGTSSVSRLEDAVKPIAAFPVQNQEDAGDDNEDQETLAFAKPAESDEVDEDATTTELVYVTKIATEGAPAAAATAFDQEEEEEEVEEEDDDDDDGFKQKKASDNNKSLFKEQDEDEEDVKENVDRKATSFKAQQGKEEKLLMEEVDRAAGPDPNLPRAPASMPSATAMAKPTASAASSLVSASASNTINMKQASSISFGGSSSTSTGAASRSGSSARTSPTSSSSNHTSGASSLVQISLGLWIASAMLAAAILF